MSFAFFDTLFQSGTDGRDLGYVVLSLFPEGRFDPAKGPVQSHYFAWPSQKDDLVAFCLHNSEKDIYTVPALFKRKGSRRANNIAHQWAAYADADSLPLKHLKAEPTMVVETSPGRHHLYWVTSVDSTKKLTEISRAIAHEHASDGCDPSGWDAGQLLRVPGTTNNKYAAQGHAAWEVKIKNQGNSYSLSRLQDTYPKVEEKALAIGDKAMPPMKDWDSTPEVVQEATEIFHYNPDVYDMYSAELREGQDRSATMWRLLSELSRAGCTRTTAMYVGWTAKCNKYKIDGRPASELWAELCRAYADPANSPITTSVEAVERELLDASAQNPENLVKDLLSTVQIVRDDERPKVPQDTFVDHYATWAATRTDSPAIYHRAGAMTLLTSVFGEFGSCPTKFDSNLTLWFLLLGPTTRARKTTAMMLWVDMISDLENERFNYILGSDVTSEALAQALPKRDGRTSVFYRDEAHGLLYEQDKKRYLAGVREHMTELYGGRVRKSLRASTYKDEDAAAPSGNIRTNFVMFLCGTLDQVTAALTIDDYQSGHLPRFLVAEADPPPMTEEDMYIEQYDGVDRTEDVRRSALMNDLDMSRSFWLKKTPPGKTRIVPFTPDAWHRLGRAKWKLVNTAQNHEMVEVLLPTADRMGTSMMKTAVLLAMAERCTTVEMKHVLKAMELAEEWYGSTARIVGRIMHSAWAGQQEEMLTVIRSRLDGVTQQEIYSRFRTKLQEKDIEGILTLLLKSGAIRKISEKGRIRYIRVSRA